MLRGKGFKAKHGYYFALKEGGCTQVNSHLRVSKAWPSLSRLFYFFSLVCFVSAYYTFYFIFLFFSIDDEDERNSYRSFDNGMFIFMFIFIIFKNLYTHLNSRDLLNN